MSLSPFGQEIVLHFNSSMPRMESNSSVYVVSLNTVSSTDALNHFHPILLSLHWCIFLQLLYMHIHKGSELYPSGQSNGCGLQLVSLSSAVYTCVVSDSTCYLIFEAAWLFDQSGIQYNAFWSMGFTWIVSRCDQAVVQLCPVLLSLFAIILLLQYSVSSMWLVDALV